MPEKPWRIPGVPPELVSWAPLRDKEDASDRYQEMLGLNTDTAKWGVGQLLYLHLDWESAGEAIDFDRVNYDRVYGDDFATLASILNTNRIPCRSWHEVKRILEVYNASWINRLLISFFCEGIGQVGCVGKPLYYSELIGYRKGSLLKRRTDGFLDILARDPGAGFDWMIQRMFEKAAHWKVRFTSRKMLGSSRHYCLVFPFLTGGSHALASFQLLEEAGGKEAAIGSDIQEELSNLVYMMLIRVTANLTFFSPNNKLFNFDDLFRRLSIQGLVHFGGDTSIRTSPHFLVLTAEVGHYLAPDKSMSGELADSMFRQQAMSVKRGLADEELTFSRGVGSGPPEMRPFVQAHKRYAKREKTTSRYTISPEYLKRIRQPGHFSWAPEKREAPKAKGRQRGRKTDQDQTLKMVGGFIQVNDLPSKRRYLTSHPELLDEQAMAVALMIMDHAADCDDSELFHQAADSADLLGRCLKKGLDAGLEDHRANRRSFKDSMRMMKALKG